MKFKVMCRQFVEEVAAIEVEAGSAEEARQLVLDNDMMIDADWSDGSDSMSPEVYAVKDENNDDVWEANV